MAQIYVRRPTQCANDGNVSPGGPHQGVAEAVPSDGKHTNLIESNWQLHTQPVVAETSQMGCIRCRCCNGYTQMI